MQNYARSTLFDMDTRIHETKYVEAQLAWHLGTRNREFDERKNQMSTKKKTKRKTEVTEAEV